MYKNTSITAKAHVYIPDPPQTQTQTLSSLVMGEDQRPSREVWESGFLHRLTFTLKNTAVSQKDLMQFLHRKKYMQSHVNTESKLKQ